MRGVLKLAKQNVARGRVPIVDVRVGRGEPLVQCVEPIEFTLALRARFEVRSVGSAIVVA